MNTSDMSQLCVCMLPKIMNVFIIWDAARSSLQNAGCYVTWLPPRPRAWPPAGARRRNPTPQMIFWYEMLAKLVSSNTLTGHVCRAPPPLISNQAFHTYTFCENSLLRFEYVCIVVKSCLTFEFECSSWLYGDELNSGFLALAVGARMLESTAAFEVCHTT